jgi:triosephosphate isomerase
MRKPVIAGNWKMNLTVQEAITFVNGIKDELDAIHQVERVIAPPHVALTAMADLLGGTGIGLAAQNMHYLDKGAFTGEVSPLMLKGLCQYVIVGHSERRMYFGETDQTVNQKVHAALIHGLAPIMCVGENLEQNESRLTDSWVAGQVQAGLVGLSSTNAQRVIIAYEPVWAIGTGRACDAITAQHVIQVIRSTLSILFGEQTAQVIRIQYGGSVDVNNIAGYMRQPDIDGALVGGASLKSTWPQLTRLAVVDS